MSEIMRKEENTSKPKRYLPCIFLFFIAGGIIVGLSVGFSNYMITSRSAQIYQQIIANEDNSIYTLSLQVAQLQERTYKTDKQLLNIQDKLGEIEDIVAGLPDNNTVVQELDDMRLSIESVQSIVDADKREASAMIGQLQRVLKSPSSKNAFMDHNDRVTQKILSKKQVPSNALFPYTLNKIENKKGKFLAVLVPNNKGGNQFVSVSEGHTISGWKLLKINRLTQSAIFQRNGKKIVLNMTG